MKNKYSKKLRWLYDCLHDGIYTQRAFISNIKGKADLEREVIELTYFLNEYNVSFNERLYYVIHDIEEPIKCKYCDSIANFKDFNDGYRKTCKNKNCIAKMRSEISTGNTKTSENREKKFKDWESTITSPSQLNDDVIKENIVADKYLQMLTNEIILDYLNNRLSDSESLWETWHRIVHNRTEPKPICARPGCNNPVHYKGREKHIYTYYCSDSCRANSPETHQKMKDTQVKNWGNECCFKSEKYQQKMIEETGYAFSTQTPEVREKAKQTNLERYGVEYSSQNPEIAQKISNTLHNIPRQQNSTSKEENYLADALTKMGFAYIREFKSKLYPFHADFTIVNYNKVFIIEYQGGKFHNTHPYDSNNNADVEEARLLKEKANTYSQETGKSTNVFRQKHYIWTKSDVKKRNIAKDNNVLLLEIYPYSSPEELVSQIKLFIDDNGLYRDDNKIKTFMDNIDEYRFDYDVVSSDNYNPTDTESLDDEYVNLSMLIKRKRKRGEKLTKDEIEHLCNLYEERNFDSDFKIIEI